ncbi:MAG: glutamine--fructose-6-phosphate transaminase (isomerizing), partial [Bacteroidaceae bacterium]|nr:glutamine--fructose-6-phosphate transaminase (isomerizing) [Bacteroidaceae bacterium]
MCGIIGYIGNREAYPVLIKGLKRLEYRGYDSAGVATISKTNQLNVYKEKGKVADLEMNVAGKDVSGTIGIAHTRWATHGEPCQANAHPHYSSTESLALVHNGIIENYAALKNKLQAKGYTFKSETDTEVLIQLIEYIQSTNHLDLLSAVQLALGEVIGAYAIAVLQKNSPNEIVAARKSSPLVIGIGKEEYFLASDATPIVEYTDQVVYLEDEEIALIRRGEQLKVVNLHNVECKLEITKVALKLGQLEKEGYPHFMLKEIFEQPQCVRDCMRGRVNIEGTNVVLSAIIDYKEKLLKAKRFIIIACGTSWHAGLIGKHLLESYCRIPTEVAYASEFRYANPVIDKEDVIIAISQSGETADTLAAVQLAREKGAFVYGICNAVGSSISRATDTGSYIHVGPEIGVASTKAFTGQVTVLTMMALTLARAKETINETEFIAVVKALNEIPEKMTELLQLNNQIAELAKIFTYAHNFI